MTLPLALPEPLLARFRASAFERLDRIDTAWTSLTQGSAGPRADEEMFRELHTLKGDARVVGYADVAVLCQRLEDLLSAARRRRYRVHEDVDVVVTMAIQFAGMLLRKTAGAARGIDLEGFLTQIEVVLTEWLRRSSHPPASLAVPRHGRLVASSRAPAVACERLAIAATSVYLEQLRAPGAARERLRDIWSALLREVVELEATPLGPVVAGHAAAAKELAAQLGKSVDVVVDGVDVRVNLDVLDALNIAILHALRNAVDHGIATPDERAREGKAPTAALRVTVREHAGAIEVAVADDGVGVDFDAVRCKALAEGLAPIEALDDARLAELLFAPGFSTREQVTEISGRGVGLEAVRAAARRLGGNARIESARGLGTTLHVCVPNRRGSVDVHVFRAPGSPLLFALDPSWEPDHEGEAPAAGDPLALLELPHSENPPAAAPVTLRRGNHCCALLTSRPLRPATAVRICRTPEHTAVEVVQVDGGEALLLRPAALAGLSIVEVTHG